MEEAAEFMRNKFLTSLGEAESELSGSNNFLSYFEEIAIIVRDIQLCPVQEMTIGLLSNANDALAECRMFTNECKELNKKLLRFNPFNIYFIRNMKRRLKAIEREMRERPDAPPIPWPPSDPMRERLQCTSDGILRESEVFGFDEQAEEIERLLFGGESGDVTKIGIVGMAGVGKTTLVQKVLHRPRVRGTFFPIICVCLSDFMVENENMYTLDSRVVTCIVRELDCADYAKGAEASFMSDTDTELVSIINRSSSAGTYLIVLDDMWQIDYHTNLFHNLPESLLARLHWNCGGAVIATSRIPKNCRAWRRSSNLIALNPMDGDTCWLIFMDFIRRNKEVLNMSQLDTLEKIKDEIKAQCHGLPLAAKILARIIPKRIRQIEY